MVIMGERPCARKAADHGDAGIHIHYVENARLAQMLFIPDVREDRKPGFFKPLRKYILLVYLMRCSLLDEMD
jgi:hypothetical protein